MSPMKAKEKFTMM